MLYYLNIFLLVFISQRATVLFNFNTMHLIKGVPCNNYYKIALALCNTGRFFGAGFSSVAHKWIVANAIFSIALLAYLAMVIGTGHNIICLRAMRTCSDICIQIQLYIYS